MTFSPPSHIITDIANNDLRFLSMIFGVMLMATKSILKSVNIRSRKDVNALANAMEHARDRKAVPIKMSRPVSDATEEEIKKMFGDKSNDRI